MKWRLHEIYSCSFGLMATEGARHSVFRVGTDHKRTRTKQLYGMLFINQHLKQAVV